MAHPVVHSKALYNLLFYIEGDFKITGHIYTIYCFCCEAQSMMNYRTLSVQSSKILIYVLLNEKLLLLYCEIYPASVKLLWLLSNS